MEQWKHRATYFGLDQVSRVATQTAGQPGLQTLGKVPNGLSEGSWDGSQDFGDQEVHDALVQDVVAGVEKFDDGLAAGKEEQLVPRKLLV